MVASTDSSDIKGLGTLKKYIQAHSRTHSTAASNTFDGLPE
jgi:hypothetical protein